ncbi:2-oxoglutarate dehydrogenase complex dihydrolipoyllysine-residue succinyltransferase [Flavitalea sp. BT771]|uniref:2-oxoglutarate dehydrogenase complex dihydrolipoyllysine-residue succinyltransferase n=1 Tax=Flavitalea sp. BT771 TaxID=3063329 RepID=UPI0026E219F8|nr:2-oxoglutarate dehydrogenase complex dihydrolipoyllysine-residue succinyltransferase [Flavitalea sp. BT771]MDO6429204.1 2-oxoglutarate dehydrogenase complex dihydrolipoyllysine-residue succinyltransferase [Flavitalea sp. BT771]MDV6218668.1 2-oxoglutarate dehydrogenase complex dihydrolipoyllysine-residue succinyltransferase [Flavitalea sp. BT771]
MIDIKVPAVGESISEVTLVKWLKQAGAYVDRDEVIAELESEKATFEVNAEQAGVLNPIGKEGDTLKIGDVVAQIDETAAKPSSNGSTAGAQATAAATSAPATTAATAAPTATATPAAQAPVTSIPNDIRATPVAAAIISDKKIDAGSITPSGAGGKILKHDVLEALAHPGRTPGKELFTRADRREKMSNLRKTVSRRLVEAKNTTAMLTTFNEVDMSAVMALRTKYKDKFKEKHGVNLGFMSFFTKATCYALQEWPAVNAYIDGEELVYHDYCDISIAVSAPKGLVVPVIRNAESLSMADIEKKVVELATKARDNKLSMEEMQGGTFTITNGGVFGSLMSTPIINIPQSAILGMHKIEERAVVVGGQIVVRPMMYLAVSYDHRIIDGRESVSFLVRIKELLENPDQLLFGKDPVKALLEL